MSQHVDSLYAKLLGETARISWQELAPFFAKGQLLWVAGSLDLIEAAQAVAEDNGQKVMQWMQAGLLAKVDAERAEDYLVRDPELWAVVLAPWVMIQERHGAPTLQ